MPAFEYGGIFELFIGFAALEKEVWCFDERTADRETINNEYIILKCPARRAGCTTADHPRSGCEQG